MSSNDRRKKCLRLSRKGYWLRVAPIALICIGLAGSVRAFIELKRSDELIRIYRDSGYRSRHYRKGFTFTMEICA